MEERRRHVRSDVRLRTKYSVLPEGASREAATADIGGGGLRLVTDQPLPIGSRLQLATNLITRRQFVHAIGEVVWSQQHEVRGKTGARKSAHTGIRFIEIAPQDDAAVSQFVTGSLR